jgi:hypothetical protein
MSNDGLTNGLWEVDKEADAALDATIDSEADGGLSAARDAMRAASMLRPAGVVAAASSALPAFDRPMAVGSGTPIEPLDLQPSPIGAPAAIAASRMWARRGMRRMPMGAQVAATTAIEAAKAPAPAASAATVGATSTKIPRLLHAIWVGPHDPPMDLIESWREKHSAQWTLTLWRDHKSFNGVPWKNQAIIDRIALREWNGVADVMRYEILEAMGGVAIDADSECLQSFDEGPEDFMSNSRAVLFYEHEELTPGVIACGVMAAPAGSAFFAECVRRIASADTSLPSWRAVGPLLVTAVAQSMPNAVKVMPSKWVYPQHHTRAKAPGVDGIKPFAKQYWGGTVGYNQLRKQPCRCSVCMTNTCTRPAWG